MKNRSHSSLSTDLTNANDVFSSNFDLVCYLRSQTIQDNILFITLKKKINP